MIPRVAKQSSGCPTPWLSLLAQSGGGPALKGG